MHAPAEILSRWFDAMLNGDRETFAELIAENAVWHVPGLHPLAGDYHGRADVVTFFEKLARTGTFRRQLVDVFGSDQHAVALLQAEGERGQCDLQRLRRGRLSRKRREDL